MIIEIVDRDKENGHYDIRVDGARAWKIRGNPSSQTLFRDEVRPVVITFPSVTSAIAYVMATYITDPVFKFE